MVIEFLQGECSVDIQLTVVVNGITIGSSVLIRCSALPVIGGVKGSIGIHPVEDRNQVQWQLIGGREGLSIVEGCSHVFDAGPYGILPGSVLRGIEVLIDLIVRLLNLRMSGTAEVHVQVLGDVPANREVTVPEELG